MILIGKCDDTEKNDGKDNHSAYEIIRFHNVSPIQDEESGAKMPPRMLLQFNDAGVAANQDAIRGA